MATQQAIVYKPSPRYQELLQIVLRRAGLSEEQAALWFESKIDAELEPTSVSGPRP